MYRWKVTGLLEAALNLVLCLLHGFCGERACLRLHLHRVLVVAGSGTLFFGVSVTANSEIYYIIYVSRTQLYSFEQQHMYFMHVC